MLPAVPAPNSVFKQLDRGDAFREYDLFQACGLPFAACRSAAMRTGERSDLS
jgi:hypothetical protein